MSFGPPASFGAPPPPPAAKKGLTCGLIALIVAAVSVPILGVLSALAIYGVRRYLVAAKTAEAKNTVGAIARASAAAYERDSVDDSGQTMHALCASRGADAPGHGPVPVDFSKLQGRKYAPATGAGLDFDTGTARGGWRCLKFSMTQPMYYQYQYNAGGGYVAPSIAPGPNGFEAAAQGDLDADGVKSTFAITGSVDASGALRLSTQIYIENEFE